MRVGIIGTGWIAEKAAITLNGLAERTRKGDASVAVCEAYAVGSRSKATAEAFAETLYIMQLMDDLRRKWDVRYPMDKKTESL